MPRVVLSLSFSGDGEGLAGVAAVEDVDSWGGVVEFSDVGVDGHSGEVPFEDGAAVWVGLAQPTRASAERSMDGDAESLDSREEASGGHVTRPP